MGTFLDVLNELKEASFDFSIAFNACEFDNIL